ncbi:MAG: GIY-YIG nuclease family protein [Candidatus Daviesbacteria bacterium]|nr:GIY-YIG nuclease family protein [Candidatus Daviesbacteria bacterium]
MGKQYYVYIATNVQNNVLYTGVTNNLVKRIWEHKNKLVSGFTSKYNISRLVYYEIFEDINEVIKREKQIKAGSREKKLELVESSNSLFEDLYNSIT